MKKIFFIVLMAFQFTAYAQRSAIFFEDSGKFPSDLSNVKSWLVATTSQLPFIFKNAKTSPNQDATFQQFSLSVAQKKAISIGDSGSFFEFESASGSPERMNVQYEGQWKISAYQPNFNLNTFKPSDRRVIFQNLLFVYNISEEQSLAQFLNHYETNDKQTPLKAFISKTEKLTNKKIGIKDEQNANLKEVVQAVYLKTNRYASDLAYDIYLKNKDHKKETTNVLYYFSKFSPENAIDNFLDIATPQGKFYFEKKGVFLAMNPNLFIDPNEKNTNGSDKTPMRIGFQYLSHKIKYDRQDKPYMSLKFESLKPENDSREFQLVNEYELNKDKFRMFPFKNRQSFKAGALQEIELQLYEGSFKVFATLKMDNYSQTYCISEQKINYTN